MSCFPLPVWSHIILTSSSGLLDLKNVGLAVGNPLISCLRAQRHAIEDELSPSWIFPLPVLSRSIFMSPKGMLDPEITEMAVGISLISCLEAEIHAFEIWRPPSWIFPLPVLSHSIRLSPSGMLDLKNVGFAVGTSVIFCVLPCLEAEIHAFEVFWPPSWIFPLPVKSHGIRIHPNEEMDPKSS